MIRYEEASKVLSYCPNSGEMRWKVGRYKAKAGSVVGSFDRNGYRKVCVFRKTYFVHRLAWLLHYGEWPSGNIDHINGDRSDNRIGNLRQADQRDNCRNLSIHRSGRLVGAIPVNGRYHSSIKIGNGYQFLGVFNSENDAHVTYDAAYSWVRMNEAFSRS